MPKGQYHRRKSYGRRRKRDRVDWRARLVAREAPAGAVADAIITRPINPPPNKRARFDPRVHQQSCAPAESEMSDKEKRLQIFWYWQNTLGAPPPSEWKGHNGIVSVIVREMQLPQGSRGTVTKVLRKAWQMRQAGLVYDGRSAHVGKPSNRGRAIKSGSLDEQIVADCYEDGFSLKRTADCVYRCRKKLDPNAKPVGVSAVRNAIKRLNPVVTGNAFLL